MSYDDRIGYKFHILMRCAVRLSDKIEVPTIPITSEFPFKM